MDRTVVMTDEVSLREHIETLLAEKDLRYQQRFDANGAAISAALLAAEKAVTKAEAATERRFEAVNEFRGTLSDQAKAFVQRVELDPISQRLADLASRVDRMEGKSTGSAASWSVIVAAIGAAGVIVAIGVTVLTYAK